MSESATDGAAAPRDVPPRDVPPRDVQEADRLFDLEMRLLLEAVFLRYQHDFRHYAAASMRRRLQQAMVHFGCASLSQLQHRILHEPAVFTQMQRYFTVQVSEMFRDPGYFRALREKVVPMLRTYPSLKIWVAGCSTGEEVWSLAILLAEEGLLERTILYGTDINTESLRTAQSGIYPLEHVARFSKSYQQAGGKRSLSDYYVAQYQGAAFGRELKRHVLFADHSLATDSVFSEVQLVSCRNVLIYFDRSLQERALGLFRDALVHRGFLGLGSKESLRFTEDRQGFEELDAAERIYQKR
jgi:chemotaxis protein methyltransferase CheR